MSVNQVNTFLKDNFPTLTRALEGETWKKVTFVFLSVLSQGIIPLAIILYDIVCNISSSLNSNNSKVHHLNFEGGIIIDIPKKDSSIENIIYNHKNIILTSFIGVALICNLNSLKKIDLSKECRKLNEFFTNFTSSLNLKDIASNFNKSVKKFSKAFENGVSDFIKKNPKSVAAGCLFSFLGYVAYNVPSKVEANRKVNNQSNPPPYNPEYQREYEEDLSPPPYVPPYVPSYDAPYPSKVTSSYYPDIN